MSAHVPCCLLSVPCGVCGADVAELCKPRCTEPHQECSCLRVGDPCCERHYSRGAA